MCWGTRPGRSIHTSTRHSLHCGARRAQQVGVGVTAFPVVGGGEGRGVSYRAHGTASASCCLVDRWVVQTTRGGHFTAGRGRGRAVVGTGLGIICTLQGCLGTLGTLRHIAQPLHSLNALTVGQHSLGDQPTGAQDTPYTVGPEEHSKCVQGCVAYRGVLPSKHGCMALCMLKTAVCVAYSSTVIALDTCSVTLVTPTPSLHMPLTHYFSHGVFTIPLLTPPLSPPLPPPLRWHAVPDPPTLPHPSPHRLPSHF